MKILAGAVLGAFLSLCWSAYSATPAVEHDDTTVEAMEVAYREGYRAGITAKIEACRMKDAAW